MTSKQLNRGIQIQNRINQLRNHLAPSYKNDLKHINVFIGQLDNSSKFHTDNILSNETRNRLEKQFNELYVKTIYDEINKLQNEFNKL